LRPDKGVRAGCSVSWVSSDSSTTKTTECAPIGRAFVHAGSVAADAIPAAHLRVAHRQGERRRVRRNKSADLKLPAERARFTFGVLRRECSPERVFTQERRSATIEIPVASRSQGPLPSEPDWRAADGHFTRSREQRGTFARCRCQTGNGSKKSACGRLMRRHQALAIKSTNRVPTAKT